MADEVLSPPSTELHVPLTERRRSPQAEISGKERLELARQILVGLALFCAFILVGYGFNPSSKAFQAMFELVKIGALPVLTLMLSFYFPHAHKHEK
ncbi:hypothetical protein E4L96_21615 [Massilia arenosa]|uniref:Uncharacterized protein n=1 Tax=Zemynaea arenosa TaxID=2561931 RepID=A0A4Y9RQ15_9BURK|nr:hypothetical protein [Massilia arenosa]TFW11427.1 hypothetical protein E4L96_21615 [Massilia arenosa]